MAITIEIDHAKTRAKAAAAAGQPVVPQAVKGRIRRIKWGGLLLTLSIYYVTPFLRWDRGPNGPDQAVLLDFANGRLYAFFVEVWPQDLYLVTGLLVLASTILILTNALAGRLWCGFACPQTVWTDLFLLVERLIERRQAPAFEEHRRAAYREAGGPNRGDARMAIIGNDGLAPIRIAPDASEALRVTLTATASTQGDVVFTARDETGTTVLSAKDRFVER